MEVDSYQSEELARQRRAVAVQLYSQQLGVAHLRSKAAAAAAPKRRSGGAGGPGLNLAALKATDPQRRRQHLAEPRATAPTPAAAADTVRIVCGDGGQQQQQQPPAAGRSRRRVSRPVASELAGFSPVRGEAGGAVKPAAAALRAAVAAAAADAAPPPGWVRINADGEELEAAPEVEDYVMQADDAAFDEEEWV